MGWKNRLYCVSHWLGTFPSLFYVGIYVVLLLLFTGAYYFLPNQSFHHSTVQYEAASDAQFVDILQELQNQLNSDFKALAARTNQTSKTLENKWHLDSEIYLTKLEIEKVREDIKVNLLLSTTIEVPNEGNLKDVVSAPLGGAYCSIEIPASFIIGNDALKATQIIQNPAASTYISMVSIPEIRRIGVLSYPIADSDLLDNQRDIAIRIFSNPGNAITPQIALPGSLVGKIIAYARSTQGAGEELSGNLYRMFYLSAATITTVGYGDIVPLTTCARVMVSVEAISGIVLIGLFLNSLAYRAADIVKP